MRERTGQILKIACYALAALLLSQLVRTALRINPLARVTIPALPRLASDTNAPAPEGGKMTNSVATQSKGTNSPVAKTPKERGTNLVADVAGKLGATNSAGPLTPALSPSEGEREKAPRNGIADAATNGSNVIYASPVSYPSLATNVIGTNALAKPSPTNSPSSKSALAGMNMNPSLMRSGGGGKSDLPPEIKARVDRIYESELFGQIMRPQPMALQGIAGNSAFLRSPSGQTGLVKEGDSLGEIKLLRIGINRVLVEQDGQKSELTIFNGYGGESLMPKDKETSK